MIGKPFIRCGNVGLESIFENRFLLSSVFFFSLTIVVFLLTYSDVLKEFRRIYGTREININKLSTVKESGTRWDAPKNVIIPKSGITIHSDLIINKTRVEISLDNNDSYNMFFYLDDSKIGKLQVNKTNEPDAYGLFIYRLNLPKSVLERGFNKIRLIPISGDGMYSIGHMLFR